MTGLPRTVLPPSPIPAPTTVAVEEGADPRVGSSTAGAGAALARTGALIPELAPGLKPEPAPSLQLGQEAVLDVAPALGKVLEPQAPPERTQTCFCSRIWLWS